MNLLTSRLAGKYTIEYTTEHVHIAFEHPHRVLSSAVLNGGFAEADHIVNLKVQKSTPAYHAMEPPAVSLQKHCADSGLQGLCVGMMTAASMDSMRLARKEAQGVEIAVVVTTGLSNPRRAGDRSESREMITQQTKPGTINTIVLTNASLTKAAMVEAVMIATEAKTAVLQDLAVQSPVSNAIATGTGTDAIAMACGHSELKIEYAGKHTLFGELLARSIMESIAASIEKRSIGSAE